MLKLEDQNGVHKQKITEAPLLLQLTRKKNDISPCK